MVATSLPVLTICDLICDVHFSMSCYNGTRTTPSSWVLTLLGSLAYFDHVQVIFYLHEPFTRRDSTAVQSPFSSLQPPVFRIAVTGIVVHLYDLHIGARLSFYFRSAFTCFFCLVFVHYWSCLVGKSLTEWMTGGHFYSHYYRYTLKLALFYVSLLFVRNAFYIVHFQSISTNFKRIRITILYRCN